MRRSLLLVACLFVPAWSDPVAHAQPKFVSGDWPCFRGPGHQGHAEAGDFPILWGPTENIGWKIKLPGPGASSPAVAGERVFVTCFTGKKDKELVRHLLCFDRKTGKQLWEEKRPAPQPENSYTGHLLQHGFATATPCVDGERIFVSFGRGGVFAFDLNGKQLWHRELGKYLNSFGSGSSPSVHGDMLLVNATTEAGALFALKKATGETIWKTKVAGDCWATPVVVTTAKGAKEIVLNAQDGLYGFDLETGRELWSCDTVGGYVSCTPVVNKDIVYLFGIDSGRKHALAVRTGGRDDVSKSHVLWSSTKVGASYCSPLLLGDRLYLFSGQAMCLDRKTGDVIMQNRLEGINQLYSSPILAGGRIYVFTRNQGAYVLSADEKLTVLAHNDLGDSSSINASPAASGGALFIRTQEYLYCLQKKQ